MKRLLLVFLFGAALAAAQSTLSDPTLPSDVVSYLGLKADQIAEIATNNRGLADYEAQKARRQAQVNAELAVELNKDPLDSMALGLRYLELESIRREIEAERKRVTAANYGRLNEEQKAKLATLEAAAKLYSTACASAVANIASSEAPALACGRYTVGSLSLSGIPVPTPR